MFNKPVVTSSVILALSALITTMIWAQTLEDSAATEETEVNDKNLSDTECVPQAQIDLMSDENVEKLELPVCVEGEAAIENDVTPSENEVTETENEVMTTETEVTVEESTFPNANETLYEDQKSSD